MSLIHPYIHIGCQNLKIKMMAVTQLRGAEARPDISHTFDRLSNVREWNRNIRTFFIRKSTGGKISIEEVIIWMLCILRC